MKNTFLLIIFSAAALFCSCNSEEDAPVAEQNFTTASGMYYGSARGIEADSLVLTFEAGVFTGGRPTGEAKRLTITCYVLPMFEDEIYLEDGSYTAAGPDGELPVFLPGSIDTGILEGTYLEAWVNANNRSVALFTGGSVEITYSLQTEQYTISAALTDAADNTFVTTYTGQLELSLPEIVYDDEPANLTALYYGDGDSTRPQRWVLDLFSDNAATGGYTGIFLDIHANRIFAEGSNTLQEGEYRLGSAGAAGTYVPGSGESGTPEGSYYYVMDKDQNVASGIYITGGTFTISRNAANGAYTLAANLRGRGIDSGEEQAKTLKFTGNPVYLDMTEEQTEIKYK